MKPRTSKPDNAPAENAAGETLAAYVLDRPALLLAFLDAAERYAGERRPESA